LIQDNTNPDVDDVVDRVQNVLLGPLMENLRAANPETPDLSPALKQIMDGFRGLNHLMNTSASTKPADGDEVEMKSE
jgi:hypothetical protein